MFGLSNAENVTVYNGRLPIEKSSASVTPPSTIDSDPSATDSWQQGQLIELTITDLSHSGDGVGRDRGRVVFVPDTVVGDRILARLVRVKPQFAQGKLHKLLDASPHRIRPACIVADKCGGCQWQHVDYAFQLEAKRNLVVQDLQRIGGFSDPPVDPVLIDNQEGLPSSGELGRGDSEQAAAALRSICLGYRNKATYPLRRSQSGQVQAGYYQKGSHALVNLNQCPIQDARLNPLLAGVKQDIQQQGWLIYDEHYHRGEIRHLGLRVGRRTGEILLTLVVRQGDLPGLEAQAQQWMERYPNLVGVLVNVNPARTNAIFGQETRLLAGRSYLKEIVLGLEFQVHPTTFFQVNTEQAEALLQTVIDHLQLTGNEVVLDAYAGIGTITLPIAQRVKRAIAVELQPEATEQARLNAEINTIQNVTFLTGAVETILPTLIDNVQAELPNLVILDPPRKGCEQTVLDTLLTIQPERIVYISCNPATLARDLKILCETRQYQLTRVQPADFFPQTPHVECAAFLERSPQI